VSAIGSAWTPCEVPYSLPVPAHSRSLTLGEYVNVSVLINHARRVSTFEILLFQAKFDWFGANEESVWTSLRYYRLIEVWTRV
jgi:hypothetical protein